MKKIILKLFVFLTIFAILGLIIMGLFNAILPTITGWGKLSYLQAIGLFILCRLLFGNLSGVKKKIRLANSEDKEEIKKTLQAMSFDEKREYIRNYMQGEKGQR